MGEELAHHRRQVRRVVRAEALDAGCLRDRREVRVLQVRPEGDEPGGHHLELHEVQRVVVEHERLHGQVVLHERQQLAEHHGQPAVAGHRHHLAGGVDRLGADRLGDRVGHGAVGQGADDPAAPVHRQVPGGPDHRGADVGQEHHVVVGQLVEEAGHVLRMHASASRGGQLVEVLAGLGVVLERLVQERRRRVPAQQRQQGLGRLLHAAHERHVHGHPSADLLAAHVHLDDRGVLGVELPVRQGGAEDQQRLGLLERVVAGGEAEQAGQADVIRVVVLDPVLAAQRVDDRGLQALRQGHDLVVGAGRTRAGQDGDPLGRVQGLGGLAQHGVGRDDAGRRVTDHLGLRGELGEGHVARDHEHGHAPLLDGGPHRGAQHAGHLVRRGDVLHVDGALAEQVLRVGLLEVARADLLRRDVRGDREHRGAGALRVEQAVDQVEVARTARAHADRELIRELGLGGGGEGRGLLVPGVHPLDAAVGAQGLGQPVEGVPGHAVHAAHARGVEGLDDVLGDSGHGGTSLWSGGARAGSAGAPLCLPR